MKTKELDQGGIGRHTLIMGLCCLIPLVALAVIWATGSSASYIILVVILFCPLLHILMIRNILRGIQQHEKQNH